MRHEVPVAHRGHALHWLSQLGAPVEDVLVLRPFQLHTEFQLRRRPLIHCLVFAEGHHLLQIFLLAEFADAAESARVGSAGDVLPLVPVYVRTELLGAVGQAGCDCADVLVHLSTLALGSGGIDKFRLRYEQLPCVCSVPDICFLLERQDLLVGIVGGMEVELGLRRSDSRLPHVRVVAVFVKLRIDYVAVVLKVHELPLVNLGDGSVLIVS